MNKKEIILLFIVMMMLTVFSPISGDNVKENPSVYSFAEIVKTLPQMWMANPAEVTEMMKDYPEFTCQRDADTISCQSLNNRNCADINIALKFTSEDDYAEFEHVTFTMEINNTEDVQKTIENFWLEDLKPAKISGASYPQGQVTIYFSSENTLVCYAIPIDKAGVRYLQVDFGFVRG